MFFCIPFRKSARSVASRFFCRTDIHVRPTSIVACFLSANQFSNHRACREPCTQSYRLFLLLVGSRNTLKMIFIHNFCYDLIEDWMCWKVDTDILWVKLICFSLEILTKFNNQGNKEEIRRHYSCSHVTFVSEQSTLQVTAHCGSHNSGIHHLRGFWTTTLSESMDR